MDVQHDMQVALSKATQQINVVKKAMALNSIVCKKWKFSIIFPVV